MRWSSVWARGSKQLCGFCYGAKLYGRVKEAFFFCIKCGTVFLSVCALLGFIFSTSIISIFRDDAAVVAVGSVALQWQVLGFGSVASIVLTNMLMQTIRKPVRARRQLQRQHAADFSSFRSIFILPYFFGLLGVEMCQMWADCCSFAVAVPIAWSAFRDMRREADGTLGKATRR